MSDNNPRIKMQGALTISFQKHKLGKAMFASVIVKKGDTEIACITRYPFNEMVLHAIHPLSVTTLLYILPLMEEKQFCEVVVKAWRRRAHKPTPTPAGSEGERE